MKKILALLLALAAGPALAADNIPVTAGSGTPIRSTDTSVGATGAGPYVNWYTLSTAGAAGTAPTVLYAPAGSSNTNAISIQGVASGTAVPISGTITANQGSPPWTVNPGTPANWGIAANNSTLTANGVLIQGSVTTGAPTYTTGNASPLSLDTAGNLRVNVVAGGGSGGTSSTFGAAFPGTGTAIGVQSGSNMIAWPAKAANTVANTDVVPEVAVANANGNGQATMTNSSPVTLASNQSVADPCTFQAKTNLPISTNATTLSQIIAANGSTKIYICSLAVVAPGATAFSLNTGTGTNCGTSTAAVIGSTTAANGMSFAANGGLTLGNGESTVAIANLAGAELCTLQSNAVQVAGNLTYVQQ